MDGHKFESLEVIVDNEPGLIVEPTIALRPYPALKLFRDAMYAVLKDKLPPDVSIPDNPEVCQPYGDRHDVRRAAASEKLQTGDVQDGGVVDFVAEVLETYHTHFWWFFKINAPAL